MKPSLWIDADARRRLESVITEAEQHTEGEIVLMVVRACDAYEGVGWRVGVSLAVLASLGVAALDPTPAPLFVLAAQGVALLAGHGLAHLEPLRRHLLPHALVERRVAERARRAFAERGLERTRARTGILLFVAALERRVVVLGDVGIDAALDPDESWQQVIDLAVAGLREGGAVEGLEAALRRCAEMLARHVPALVPRIDQLPDAVVVED
jgi:putative membrane protein